MRFHWRRVRKVGPEVKHGLLAAYGPARTVKTGAGAMDQVRVEGSVLPAFDRAGLVKLNRFARRCGGFAVGSLKGRLNKTVVIVNRVFPRRPLLLFSIPEVVGLISGSCRRSSKSL